MKNLQLSSLLILVTCMLMHSAYAQCAHQSCCVCGKKVCVLKVSKEEESVTRFDVESKEVCIPGIKLPWSCTRHCGGVRNVCVLKEVKQEKTVCKYDWSIRTICTTCCRRHGLKHHHSSINKPVVNQDKRLAFEYYAADAVQEQELLASPGPLSEVVESANSQPSTETRPIVSRIGLIPGEQTGERLR